MDNSSYHRHTYEVAIIGAGVSGLTAGKLLQSQGVDYVILEGNSRVGGRTWTISIPSAKNESELVNLDLGGAWIHGSVDNPIYDFLSQYSLEFINDSSDDEALVVGSGGLVLSNSKFYSKVRKDFLQFIKAMKKCQSSEECFDMSMEDIFQHVLQSPKYEKYHDKESVHWHALDLFKTSWELYNGASFKDLSVWDEDIVCPGGDILIKGGYKILVEILSNNLNIEYCKHVIEIDDSRPKCTKITCKDGSIIKAKRVIVSLPLGVLQSGDVTFKPPLPSWKVDSIHSMGMGLMDKLILQFSNCFWDSSIKAYKYLRQDRKQFSWISNFYPSTGEPILVLISAADTAEYMNNLTDDEVLEKAMHLLHDIFGDKVEQPLRTIRTKWKDNVFSRGSYSYCKAGSRPIDVRNLAAPVNNRLFFCGEHTISEYLGCVHSAFVSGKRVSLEVINSLNQTTNVNCDASPYGINETVPMY